VLQLDGDPLKTLDRELCDLFFADMSKVGGGAAAAPARPSTAPAASRAPLGSGFGGGGGALSGPGGGLAGGGGMLGSVTTGGGRADPFSKSAMPKGEVRPHSKPLPSQARQLLEYSLPLPPPLID
jgi:hypothetical protein